ncbi:hypothetical protein [Streptomyces fagopyri]
MTAASSGSRAPDDATAPFPRDQLSRERPALHAPVHGRRLTPPARGAYLDDATATAATRRSGLPTR